MQNLLWGRTILHGICFSLLVLGLALNPFRFLVNAKTAYLGRVSYSMYLFHPLIIFTIIPVYRLLYASTSSSLSGYLSSLLVTLIVLMIVSLISYRWIERTGMAFGEKFIKRNQ